VEDNSTSFSDRIYKSSEPWSEPYFNEIAKSNWRSDYNPKYAEVSFSNTCNFKCAYCGPEYSSKWMEEINEFGAYNLSFEYNSVKNLEERNTKPYKQTEQNPYVDAFWEWFPELYENLDTFRITGGEPLLSKDTWKVLDYIINSETPNENLKLSINSNLGIPDELVDKLITKLDTIITENRVKEIIIFTSCDGYGKQAEYTRFGMDFEKTFQNIDKILTKLPKVTVVVMSTFNIFSVFSYEQLIRKIHKLKVKHFNTVRYWNSAIILDTSYLRYPSFMSFRLLKDYIDVEYFDRWLKYMKFNSTFRSLNFHKTQEKTDVGFSTQEIEKIARLRDLFVSDYDRDIKEFDNDKKDFIKFIRQYELRRGLVCEQYYPELNQFIKNIENENKI
jgi:MoaA/NifB/PqqE/SkfB family radical SAM enzyme